MSMVNTLARQCVVVRQNAVDALVCQCVSAYIEIRTRTTRTESAESVFTQRTRVHLGRAEDAILLAELQHWLLAEEVDA
jgi:hypothetical protein